MAVITMLAEGEQDDNAMTMRIMITRVVNLLFSRKHRIDLNLLYDHAPNNLLSNAVDFVRSLAEPDHINLFLSMLTDDDVTTTLFPPPELPRTCCVDDNGD